MGAAEGAVVSEAVERIKAAEKAAEEAERAARAESKKLVTEARDTAERLFDETRRAARDLEREMVAAAAQEAEADAERLVEKNKAGVDTVRAAAEKHLEDGIRKVLEFIAAGAVANRE